MRSRRIPSFFSLFLLVPVSLSGACAVYGQVSDEAFPTELNGGYEEPQIPLPEHKGQSPFRQVSRSRRADSNDALVQLCQEAVDTTTRRMLSTEQHTPWQIMHALLGLRDEFQILHQGEPVSGLDWVAEGQVFDNEYWFEPTRYGGRAHPYSRPYAFEGHANQFLAILSMCGVDLNRSFGTATGSVTMRGMIQNAQMTVSSKDEPTWTLWALSRYLPSNAVWRNEQGETWSIEKLVQIQTQKPMRGAPCGGTHSLFALAHARNVYLRQGKPLRGVWLQAEYKIRQHINTARMQQNSNGSLSSNFFRERKYDPDFNKRMASAGHILEFLMIALPQKELNERWVRRAIEATARDLLNNRKAYVKCSPLYHSVNALNIYLDRVNPKIPVDDVASADDEEPRSAQLRTPGEDRSAQLKTVPIKSISDGKELASAEELTTEASTTEETRDDVAANAESMKNGEADQVDTPAEVQLLPRSTNNDSGSETTAESWRSTPDARRTPISVPSERVNAGIQERPAVTPESDAQTSSEDEEAVANPKAEPAPEAAEESAKESQEPVTADAAVPQTAESMPADSQEASPEQQPAEPAEPAEPVEPAEPETTSAPGASGSGVPVKSVSLPTLLEVPKESPAETPENGDSAAEPETTEPQPAEPEATEPETAEPEAATPEPQQAATEDKPDVATALDQVPEGINSNFLDPELNPEEWVKRFEIESREVFAGRTSIVKALNLKPGMAIADVGSGTGLFVGAFSKKVAENGAVYAIDISPRLIDFLDRRVKAEDLNNVTVVRNDGKSLMMKNQQVDRVFICDTYHHFEHYKEMLESIHQALRADGELILIDFDRVPGQSREWILNHVRGGKDTFKAEVLAAGFEFVEEVDIPEFKENYLLRFRKVGAAE